MKNKIFLSEAFKSNLFNYKGNYSGLFEGLEDELYDGLLDICVLSLSPKDRHEWLSIDKF